ncbi:hypothetical protein F0562_031560 [Nyssa sinensis]|uniref:Myb/SANT-like DNA-binding domain-containing protein n=1 Tax=Nyssa sinensis TaxID=561372 RepID=A0A5J5ASU8_9ASTE|nr:hypothetical protein F0562_031560 [Nyssa sinensis]
MGNQGAHTSRPHHGGGREDCWSEGATETLIDAWGDRYVQLNRGNLRQKDWKEVADAVNARQNGVKPRRTDIQCKNRVDTLKKKYKAEKGQAGAFKVAFLLSSRSPCWNQRRYSVEQKNNTVTEESAYKELARAILRFGEIYERIESSKQQQMMELEKQRMEFTKDLEFQRMNMFMEAQVELEKMKRPTKYAPSAGKKL